MSTGTPVYGEPPLDWPHYGIGFVPAIKRGFRKYATFRGRASRGEYWFWYLFLILAYLLVVAVLALAGGLSSSSSDTPGPLASVVSGLFGLAFLGLVVPTVAVAVRRLHDAGYSGWMYLIGLIPLVGGIILLVFLASDTAASAPRYGPPGELPPASPYGPSGYVYPPAQGYGPDPQGYPSVPAYGSDPQAYPPAPQAYPPAPQGYPDQGYRPDQAYPGYPADQGPPADQGYQQYPGYPAAPSSPAQPDVGTPPPSGYSSPAQDDPNPYRQPPTS